MGVRVDLTKSDRYGAAYLFKDIEKATKEPKQEVILSWVTRLEGGDYTQRAGVLHSVDWIDGKEVHAYDALGVLCELAFEAGVVKREIAMRHDTYGVYVYGGETILLPEQVASWAGLVHKSPLIKWDGDWRTLAYINDRGLADFELIAEAIRGTYLSSSSSAS